jgi:hypothetical protein
MYGILAACIAAMAMFLGLFALSVQSEPDLLGKSAQDKPAVELVQSAADSGSKQ